ncbi:MAG: hypothetical protein WC506_01940 [Candidatus Micrarchaeia archaeon]
MGKLLKARMGQISAEFLAIAAIASLFFLASAHVLLSSQQDSSMMGREQEFQSGVLYFCKSAQAALSNHGAMIRTAALAPGTQAALHGSRIDFSNSGYQASCVTGANSISIGLAGSNASRVLESPMALLSDSAGNLEVMPYG